MPLEGPPGDLARLAALWRQLPAESRCARSQSAELEWTTTDYLLWSIEYSLRCLRWERVATKKRQPPKPRPLQTPGQLAEARRRRDRALASRGEIDRILGRT